MNLEKKDINSTLCGEWQFTQLLQLQKQILFYMLISYKSLMINWYSFIKLINEASKYKILLYNPPKKTNTF